MPLQTITKRELLDALDGQEQDVKLVATCTYGDRSGTMQAVAIGEPCFGYLKKTAYSDSGYAVVEHGDEDDDAQEVVFFEDTPGIENTMTREELEDALSGYDDDTLVVACCDYGDHCHTMQAISLNDVGEVFLNKSNYSSSGYAVVEEGDEDDDAIPALVLNSNALW